MDVNKQSQQAGEGSQLVQAGTIVINQGVSEERVATVYKGNIIKNLIMDCQSYTKYRPKRLRAVFLYHGGERRNFPRGLD